MKTFTRMAAQGDFVIIRVDGELDTSNMEEIKPNGNQLVVAHSETGHNHVMVMERPRQVVAFKEKGANENDMFKMFLQVKEPTDIVHLRSFDTHETLKVPAGTYKIHRQREYVPEGFRKAQD